MPETPRPALGPLLIECARLLDVVAQAQVNHEAGDRIARPALMRLVPFLTREGIRPTELARQADITKQAVGQTLKACEAQGLVEFAADPSDGRAQLVRLTDDGEAAFRYGRSVLRHLEDELAGALGAAVIDQTTRGLDAMLPVLQAWIDAPPRRRRAPADAIRVRRLAKALRAAAPRTRLTPDS